MAAGTRGAAIQFNGYTRPAAISSAPRRPRAAPGVPIAYEDRLVVPDTLGTTIKLSFLEGPLAWRQRTTANGAGAVTYI